MTVDASYLQQKRVCVCASIYSYLCEFLQLKEDFVFEFTFCLPACLSPSISVCVCVCVFLCAAVGLQDDFSGSE